MVHGRGPRGGPWTGGQCFQLSHFLAAEVGDIPNLVFDVFCSLKIDRM